VRCPFDALHSVKANITWLVETKKAHYIAVVKTNQPTAYAQLAALPWTSIKVQHTASRAAHGRHDSRSIKTCSPERALAILGHHQQHRYSRNLTEPWYSSRLGGREGRFSWSTCVFFTFVS
jgi:hypothetical protein